MSGSSRYARCSSGSRLRRVASIRRSPGSTIGHDGRTRQHHEIGLRLPLEQVGRRRSVPPSSVRAGAAAHAAAPSGPWTGTWKGRRGNASKFSTVPISPPDRPWPRWSRAWTATPRAGQVPTDVVVAAAVLAHAVGEHQDRPRRSLGKPGLRKICTPPTPPKVPSVSRQLGRCGSTDLSFRMHHGRPIGRTRRRVETLAPRRRCNRYRRSFNVETRSLTHARDSCRHLT